MEIQVMESTIVRPAQDTPKTTLWCSNLDAVAPRSHVSTVYFYRPNDNGCSNFFDTGVLKESLSKVLVPFHPVAGRLGFDQNGRIQVECNGEGVLFIEAPASCDMDDVLDFINTPTSQVKLLVPSVDYSKEDISSYPLLLLQVTSFKCGGACLGVGFHHILVDGSSALHFISTWSHMTRGLPLTLEPIFDHKSLRARVPPTPSFDHLEYKYSPSLSTPQQNQELHSSPLDISIATLQIAPQQLNALKANVEGNFTTYEVLAAHIWRCMCKARDLPDNMMTSLYIPADGRSRLNPPLPRGYFGNAILKARLPVLAGEVKSEPLIQTVERVHIAIKRMDDDYARSVVDYLELQPDINLMRVPAAFKYPNLHVASWTKLPIYDADFGWGRPIYMGRATINIQGVAYILPSPVNDGSLALIIGLESDRIQLFEKYFYEPQTV
ncbi:shikimate O-hydroxycinnamoyltransferase-like [Tripterygium wilfordii]|uniref:Shikimate O-hydroxycinnamoyltransferase-like n=1 Tax=Tripterygium wilfordii TaxID=458696 RepID=A0A7J7BVF7_TRIWF|nr:shikimate O-hydroxycinnamoyltransferase-like [Tripterygium wilfordii]KAF5725882.1 shikimate O-hydroxycinnamoyltransferase-like [Tripterygium wilfordii]